MLSCCLPLLLVQTICSVMCVTLVLQGPRHVWLCGALQECAQGQYLSLKTMLRKMRQTTGKSVHGNSIKGWNHRGEILSTLKWVVKPLLALLGSVLHARLPVCWGMCGCVGLVRCRESWALLPALQTQASSDSGAVLPPENGTDLQLPALQVVRIT